MNYSSQIDRLSKEIADLGKAEARETKKEAHLHTKINRANETIARTKSSSTAQSKLKEVERAIKDLAVTQNKRAGISSKIADKSKSKHSYEERQSREDEKERKKIADEQRRLTREREVHERRVTSDIRSRQSLSRVSIIDSREEESYDFFISHASEDKEDFVRSLAEALRAKGARVWYDEFSLRVGDSLRRSIDRGLVNSRFGVVVLSEHFFNKEWPQKELDGLFVLENQGDTRILPVWHKVSKDEVARYSPMLADKVALNTSLKSVDEIAEDLCELIKSTSVLAN